MITLLMHFLWPDRWLLSTKWHILWLVDYQHYYQLQQAKGLFRKPWPQSWTLPSYSRLWN